jgi:hypothetical protein
VVLSDQIKKKCLGDFGNKLKMKWVDIKTKVRGDLIGTGWEKNGM